MPVPNSMADLATLASSNFPTGTEAIGNSLDNYLRAISAIVRSTNAVSSATIASASTTDIGSADGEFVIVTGSATINSLGPGFPGCRREVLFQGACTLVNSGSIFLPNAANITTIPTDIHVYRCSSAGVWGLVGMNRIGVAGITGLSTALASKLDNAGNQTLNGDLTIRNFTLLGSPTFNAQQGGRYRFNTGNVDDIQFTAQRMSPGTNWSTASLRIQRFVDGASGMGYLEFPGSASGKSVSFGLGYWGADQGWFDLSGNFTAVGNIISNSDESLKTDWHALPADFVSNLAAVKHGVYRRTDIDQMQVGVSAQSLRAVLPNAVVADSGGVLSVAYGNAALVSAIQLAIEVKALSSRLDRLEGA